MEERQDLISRREAINAVDAIGHIASITMSDGDKCIRKSAAKYVLSILPSAQPEILRCKDCIYWWESHKMCKRNKDKNHNCACMDCDADFYCGNAERRTDEGD